MTRPPHRPSLVIPDHSVDNGPTNLTENGGPAEKDRLLGEAYDLTEARVANLARAIWDSGTAHDFTQHSIAAIHRHHNIASRGRAIAALTGLSAKTGERIHKSETQHADTWPLGLAGVLPFMTLRGAAAYVCAATGRDEDEIEALLRRHLGPEIQP